MGFTNVGDYDFTYANLRNRKFMECLLTSD